MRLRIQRIAYVILVLSVFISGDLCAANGANPVVVDDHRLSVHAEGIALGELLIAIEEKTGVQFTFDELVATEKIFLDFQGLTLLEGLRKIIYPLSYATIYDDKGKVRRVILLGQWKGSEMKVPREGGNRSPEGPKPGPSDSISLTPKGSSDGSGASKGPPLGKGPVYLDGPSVDSAYSGGRGPNTQEKIPEDLPVPLVGGFDHLPVPDSEGALMEGPSVDSAYSEGGVPNTQDKIPEGLPVPLVGGLDLLPIPDS